MCCLLLYLCLESLFRLQGGEEEGSSFLFVFCLVFGLDLTFLVNSLPIEVRQKSGILYTRDWRLVLTLPRDRPQPVSPSDAIRPGSLLYEQGPLTPSFLESETSVCLNAHYGPEAQRVNHPHTGTCSGNRRLGVKTVDISFLVTFQE